MHLPQLWFCFLHTHYTLIRILKETVIVLLIPQMTVCDSGSQHVNKIYAFHLHSNLWTWSHLSDSVAYALLVFLAIDSLHSITSIYIHSHVAYRSLFPFAVSEYLKLNLFFWIFNSFPIHNYYISWCSMSCKYFSFALAVVLNFIIYGAKILVSSIMYLRIVWRWCLH